MVLNHHHTIYPRRFLFTFSTSLQESSNMAAGGDDKVPSLTNTSSTTYVLVVI